MYGLDMKVAGSWLEPVLIDEVHYGTWIEQPEPYRTITQRS